MADAPSSRATWIAAVPTPLAAACTSIVSPGASGASRRSERKAVRKTSGTAAARAGSSESGTRISCPAGTAVRSA